MSPNQKKIIYFVTGNANKFNEAKNILETDDIELLQLNIDLPEYQGELEQIAKTKCIEAQRLISLNGNNKYPFIIEDTSLCFNGLNGMPGPYIKWFMNALGLDGMVKMLEAFPNKTAVAYCYLSYVENHTSSPQLFIGKIDGLIVPKRGTKIFGWDPIFEPDEQINNNNKQTFSEMESDYKNQISHRFKALQNLKKYLSQ